MRTLLVPIALPPTFSKFQIIISARVVVMRISSFLKTLIRRKIRFLYALKNRLFARSGFEIL